MKTLCPLCKQESHLFFRTKDYNRRLSKDIFYYYRCRACSLIFLSPIPANLGDYYPPDYYAVPTTLDFVRVAAESQGYKIEIVQKFVTTGRLLEIGSSYGVFAYLAKEAGFAVDTIEMDQECCTFLRKIVDVHTIQSNDAATKLASSEFNNIFYDVIALWHVVEHLPNPWSTLEAAAKHLAPGGILVVAAPNPASFQFRVLRRYWPHADAPRHVLQIPIPLLTQQAATLGLKPIFITTTDRGTLGFNVFGWQQFLSYIFTSPRAISFTNISGRIIARLLRPIERSGLRGSTYTVVLQKLTTDE